MALGGRTGTEQEMTVIEVPDRFSRGNGKGGWSRNSLQPWRVDALSAVIDFNNMASAVIPLLNQFADSVLFDQNLSCFGPKITLR